MMKIKKFLLPLLLMAGLVLDTGCGDNQIQISVQTKQPSVDVMVNGESKLTTDANGTGTIEMQRPKDTDILRIEFKKAGYKMIEETITLKKEDKEYSLGPIELPEIIRKLIIRAFKVSEASSERLGIAGAKIIISIDDGNPRTEKTGLTSSVTITVPSKAEKATLVVEYSEPNWFISDNDKREIISLEPGKEEYIVEFLFQERRQRTINVTCVDENGKSIQGVSISRVGAPSAISDTKGQTSIRVNSLAGESIRLNFSHADFFSKDDTVTIKRGADEYPLSVTLAPKLYVSGRVVNAAGVGVYGVEVVAGGSSLGISDDRGNLSPQVRRNFSTNERIQVTEPHVLVKSSITQGDARHYVVALTVRSEPWKLLIKTVDTANQPIEGVETYVRKQGSSRLNPAGATDADGRVSAEISDLTDIVELRKHGYEPKTVSAYRPQNTPKTVVMQKASRIKVFLNVKNKAGDAIEHANVYVGKNAAPVPLDKFQGREYDLGSYQVHISPLDQRYRPWEGLMPVEDDDSDGKFTFNITLFEDLIKQAGEAEKAGDYETAVQLYSQISNENPEHISAWFKAGQIYGDKLKNYERAVEMFQKIIDENKTHALAYYNKGVYHYSAKEYPKAVEAFENVITYQRNLGDQYENIMYWTRFSLAAASYNFSNKAGLPDTEVQKYRNKAKRYSQEFKDNVPDSYQEKEEHKRLMGTINQITSAIE